MEEIEAQLAEFREQLEGIEALLLEEPENEEYVGLKKSTLELIEDLQKLLPTAPTPPKPTLNSDDSPSRATLPSQTISSTPIDVGIRATGQVEEALKRGLYVGLPSEAVWPEDGLWYPATIESIGDAGVKVKFKSYGDILTLEAKLVRASSLLGEKKRKEPTGGSSEPEGTDIGIPEHLRYTDTDTEKSRDWKKRQQKAWKSERRKEQQEVAENKAKVSWQNFSKSHKKTGTTTKKESMFRTSDAYGGKIGVIGSGSSQSKPVTSGAVPPPRYNASASSFSLPGANNTAHYDPLAAPSYYIPHSQGNSGYTPPTGAPRR
jgi:survival-of-motor-neuron-related-splicing factor 30